MSVLSDHWIKKMSLEKKMISPFVQKQHRKNKISFGLSSYGYDARVSNEFKIFTNIDSAFVDPKKFSKNSFLLKIKNPLVYFERSREAGFLMCICALYVVLQLYFLCQLLFY